MDIGIGLILTDHSPGVAVTARLIEEFGFESLWLGEHSHIPIVTRHAYSRDGSVPEVYKRFLDPFVALTVAATVTSRLRLGTSVVLPAEHNPILLAKTIATLDYVSGGRTDLGFGFGWNHPELRNNGVQPEFRRKVAREKIEAMIGIWENEVFSYSGEHVTITESWAFPKPIQTPHPPLYLGAVGTPRNFAQIAAWGSGWLPLTKECDPSAFPERVAQMRSSFSDAGRDPATARITLLETGTNTGPHMTVESFTSRLPNSETLAQFTEWGADRVIISVPAYSTEILQHCLHRAAEVLEAHRT